MKTLRSTLACTALIAALASAPLAAASDIYLKFDGVDGEAVARDAKKPTQISSFSFGAGKASMSDLSISAVAAPRDAASGLPTGRRMHMPVSAPQIVSVVLPAAECDTSRALDRACATGMHIKNAELGSSAQRLALSDVVVSSCTASSSERRYEFRGHVTLMK